MPASNPNDLTNDNIWALAEDAQNGLWVGTFRGGLNHFDLKKRKFLRYQNAPKDANSLSDNRITALLPIGKDTLWVGTPNGLNLFNTKTKKFKRYFQVPGDPQSLSSNTINALYQDRAGNIWVGTSRGLDRYNPQNGGFDHILPMVDEVNLSVGKDYGVVAIQEDPSSGLWLGTSNRCVLFFDYKRKQLRQFTYNAADPSSLSSCSIYCIYADKEDGIWFGSSNGVNRYDPKTHQFRHYTEEPGNSHGLPGKIIRTINEDNNGVIWIATNQGRVPLDLNKGLILDSEITPTLGKSLLKKGRFALSKQGDIWIGGNEGLIGWNWKNNLTQRYRHRPNDNNSIGSDTIWNVYLAKDETVWLKTATGISIFYPAEKKFENYFQILSQNNWAK
jgi:ligand-binding sensor domain-containing protein